MDNQEKLLEINKILDSISESMGEKETFILGHTMLIFWKLGRDMKAGNFNPMSFDQEYINSAESALVILKHEMRSIAEGGKE